MKSPPPLAGIRVVELTTAWAGPMAGRVLACLGAETIRIEPASRACGWRHVGETSSTFRYPDGVPGERPYNRTALFNSQNPGKLSVSIDLKRPGGHSTLLRLLSKTDIVLANFTPGTLRRLKLDYASLCSVRSDIILVEMPAYGNFGSMANNTALGPTMEMASGMSSLIGYRDDGAPTYTGPSYMDPTGGFHGAAAALTALAHRRRTGRGQYVEVPQVEAAMHYIGSELLHAIATDSDPQRQGNRVNWAAPHDAFPSAGEDQWVAIAVTKEEHWSALTHLIGDERLGASKFMTLQGRLDAQDELHGFISDWTRTRDKHEAAELLQAAGVPAAPVNKANDVLKSPYLAARQFFTCLDHPEAGSHPHPGLPFHFSVSADRPVRAAPCLGEHTMTVLSELAGMTGDELRELEAHGAISRDPFATVAA